ncbi:MAG: type II secretion system protein GspN [Myxococcota bacterium]
MAASVHSSGGDLPGWFRALVVPSAGVLLVFFFMLRGFPYEAIADRVASTLEPALGVQLEIAEFGPVFEWAGPGFQAVGVRASFADAQTLNFDRVLVRPAWTTAWFRGDLAFHVELDGPIGIAMGSLELGEVPAWEGSVQNLDLKELSFLDVLPSKTIQGRMDATFSLQMGELGPEGPVTFELRDGSLSIPNMPITLPFEEILGEFELGGDAYLTIESLTLEGPIVSGSGSGRIAKAASFARAPLQIEFDLNVKPALASSVRAAGARVDRKGDAKIRITGTVSDPIIR